MDCLDCWSAIGCDIENQQGMRKILMQIPAEGRKADSKCKWPRKITAGTGVVVCVARLERTTPPFNRFCAWSEVRGKKGMTTFFVFFVLMLFLFWRNVRMGRILKQPWLPCSNHVQKHKQQQKSQRERMCVNFFNFFLAGLIECCSL